MKSSMLSSLVLAALPLSGLAAVVTLNQVIPSGTDGVENFDLRPTEGVKFEWEAIGTASDGSQTTYKAEIDIANTGAGANPTATNIEAEATLVVSASGYAFSAAVEVVEGVTAEGGATCTFDGNGGGGCVAVNALGGEASTTTYQGSVVPAVTFTVDDPTGRPTGSNGSPAPTTPGAPAATSQGSTPPNGALAFAPVWGLASILGAMTLGAVVVL